MFDLCDFLLGEGFRKPKDTKFFRDIMDIYDGKKTFKDVGINLNNKVAITERKRQESYILTFENRKLGLSIICQYGSYGFEESKFECALMREPEGLCNLPEELKKYATDNVVCGYLSDTEVKEIISIIDKNKFY